MHSTRHSALEYGKDVVSISPDGEPCVFQLKGQPGGRLTLAGFRGIEAQLHQLVALPVNIPGVHRGSHRAFLVTNGYVEEEVQNAIQLFNSARAPISLAPRGLEVIQRGDILSDAVELGAALWPTELEEVDALLQLMVHDGNDALPLAKLHTLLLNVLGLGASSEPSLAAAELGRRITSAALLVAISLRSFDLSYNYAARISAWTLFSSYVIASCEKYEKSYARNGRQAVDIASEALFFDLTRLAEEASKADSISVGNPLSDFAFIQARRLQLLALLSLYWFWCEDHARWPSESMKAGVEGFLSKAPDKVWCWGEAAMPQCLLYYWYLRRTEASSDSELFLSALLRTLLASKGARDAEGLPSPYHTFEDVLRHKLSFLLGAKGDPLVDEDTGSARCYAESVLHLLVRTNRKAECKAIWPTFSRFRSLWFEPEAPWNFCLWRTSSGEYRQIMPPRNKAWSSLVEEARSCSVPLAPEALRQQKYLFALFLLISPQRGIPDAVRALAWHFDQSWFIEPPIGADTLR